MKLSSLVPSVLAAAGIAVTMSSFSPANAASVGFQVDQKISDDTTPITFDVQLKDVIGGVEVDLSVAPGSANTGDIFGAFFNLSMVPSPLTISGDEYTNFGFNTNDMGNGNSVQGGSIKKNDVFDVGVTFGTSGSSSGLLTSTTFQVLGADLDISKFLGEPFAVRAQSSGSEPNGGNGSTKMIGTVPNTVSNEPVPEPLTILGSATALGIGGLLKRQQSKKNNKA